MAADSEAKAKSKNVWVFLALKGQILDFFFTYILLDYVAVGSQAKCKSKFYVPESKNQICGFVGNVDADSGLTCYPHWTRFRPSRADFRSKNHGFFLEKWFFWMYDKSAGSVDNNEIMLGKVV